MLFQHLLSVVTVVLLVTSLVAVPTSVQGASLALSDTQIQVKHKTFSGPSQAQRSSNQCQTLPKGFKHSGCTTGVSALADAVRALVDVAAGDSETGKVADDVLNPMLNFVEGAMNQVKFSDPMGKTMSILKSSVCFGEFLGSNVREKSPKLLGKHGCNTMPLVNSEMYMILSFSVPTDPFVKLCRKSVDAGKDMTMCLAFALCDDLPTLAYVVNGPMIQCFLGSDAVSASSGGSSKALAQGVKAGLNMVGFGFSLGADLEYSAKVWNGKDVVTAKVEGNYYDYVEIHFDKMTEELGLPKKLFRVTGHQMRLVRVFGDAKDTTKMLAESDDSADAIGQTVKNFAVVARWYASLTIRFNLVTKGALPPTPKLEVGSFAAVVSTLPKSNTGVPEGFFATAQTGNTVNALMAQLIGYMADNLGGVVDAIMGDGAMEGFAKAITPKAGPSTVIAFAATKQEVGFFIQTPLSPISFGPFSGEDVAGKVSFSCKVRNSDGHFSCEIDYKLPKWLTAFLDGAVYIAKAALKFFDETGKIIAAVATKAAGEAVKWTKKAIEDTAKAIEDGVIVVGEAAKEWADKTVKAIDQTLDKVGDLADKGLNTVGEEVGKPEDIIKVITKPKEVVKAVVKKVVCTTKRFVNGRCGPRQLLTCGREWLSSSYRCGSTFGASVSKCGRTLVRSVAKCGWQFLRNICSGCSGCSGCGWGGCSGCSGCSGCFKKRKAARCRIAAKCRYNLSCYKPKSCWRDTICYRQECN